MNYHPATEDVGQHSLPASRIQEEALAVDSPPYQPSWIDRLTDWVRGLLVPSWAFYLAVGLGLSLVYVVLFLFSPGWANGTLDLSAVLLYSLMNGMTCVYMVGLMHHLDNAAEAALSRLRPLLTVDDAGYNNLQYQLTTLPARSTLIASGIGVVYTIFTILLNIFGYGNTSLGALSPVVLVLVLGFNFTLYVLAAVLIYHTLHQLVMVNAIYIKHTRINVFQPGPLYELSGLTAHTAIGIGIPAYIWFQVNSMSNMGTTLPDIIQAVLLGTTVIITFVWPLMGAHRLLDKEKQRILDEVAQRIEATIAEMHSRVDTGDLGDRGALKDTLDGLAIEQNVIHKLRTWPWRIETISGLGLAFTLPVIIFIVQRVLLRLGI